MLQNIENEKDGILKRISTQKVEAGVVKQIYILPSITAIL
jgi:hypothetical protein